MFMIFTIVISIPNSWKPYLFDQDFFSISRSSQLIPLCLLLGLWLYEAWTQATLLVLDAGWITVVFVSRLNPILVTIQELFSSSMDPNMVKQVFLDKTLNASSHWLGSTYHLVDIHVTGKDRKLVLWLEVMGLWIMEWNRHRLWREKQYYLEAHVDDPCSWQ